jgi:hypothetical protein
MAKSPSYKQHEECSLLECDDVWILLRTDVPPKRLLLQGRHGVTTQNMVTLIFIAKCVETGFKSGMPSSGTLRRVALVKTTRRNIPEGGILHSHRRENIKSYIALTGWTVYWRCNVSPVKYELGSYITEDGILHIHRRENLKSYIALTDRAL